MAYNKETGMYDGWIYLLTDKNGRQYVGQTTQASISVRVHQHFTNNPSNTNSMLDYTMHKYGKDYFIVEELEAISKSSLKELRDDLNQMEKYYIKSLRTHVSQGGYNITWGGNNVSYACCAPVDMYSLKYDGVSLKMGR